MTDLVSSARALFAEGKGILAADESVPTATKRLAQYGISTSEETRRKFREFFLNAPRVEEFLSGVILHEETLGQKGDDKKKFPLSLAARGIAPGIKVDQGTEPFPESPNEVITNGLIGLPERLAAFKKQGATFTKWRAVIRIEGDELPTNQAIVENAKRLAMYAKEVQAAGMIPILEPEVLLEGTHSRKRAREVLEETLSALFSVVQEQAVDLSGVVLKTAMALSGNKNPKKDTSEEVAEDTVAALIASVPPQVAGIVFLSGGQTPDEATEHLRAIMQKAQTAHAPWPLTFSYARALQEEALAAWQGKDENMDAAREVYLVRLAKVSAALKG